jgi:hypothetical protein
MCNNLILYEMADRDPKTKNKTVDGSEKLNTSTIMRLVHDSTILAVVLLLLLLVDDEMSNHTFKISNNKCTVVEELRLDYREKVNPPLWHKCLDQEIQSHYLLMARRPN